MRTKSSLGIRPAGLSAMRHGLLTLVISAACVVCHAQLRLPGIYSDHMVIQQNATVPIWGWSSPTQAVRINVSWDTATVRVKSANTTFWKTSIKTPPAGGPHTITIVAGNEQHVIQDVLSGEVWLSSGQSNMEWTMAASGDGATLINQVNDTDIRLFQVPKSAAEGPQLRGEGRWTVCDKNTVSGFSAVAYFFGKKLNQNIQQPVGLINASWGGTPAEAWVPSELIEGDDLLRQSAAKQIDDKPWCPSRPAVVYNAMINPLLPYRLAGALWYQGEANTVAPATYKRLMETLIGVWRKDFQTDFPFYYVQIAPFKGYGEIEKGTLIREQQVLMQSIPNTGMVVVSDLVDNINDIHPRFKKPVGERLADLALAKTYGKTGIVYQSPQYASMKVDKQRVRILFDHADTGLDSKSGVPGDFLIAGADRKFYPATAKIDGNSIVVVSKQVKQPVAVRYAWSNGSVGNVFGKSGLPVSSFRTDDWPIPVD